ncbi:MAG: holo-ACP synthase [Bacilli bacterium]|nr:holo-ACP synthase [Bacilli bacterium]
MIEKIGVDISKNERFRDFIFDAKKYGKILSPQEIVIFNGFDLEKRRIEYLASRFSGKEALYKAYNKKFSFDKVSILNDETGAPYIEADFLNEYIIHISLSHEIDNSIAFVILEKK